MTRELNGQLVLYDTQGAGVCVLLVDNVGQAHMIGLYQQTDAPTIEVDTWCVAILTYDEKARRWTKVEQEVA